MPLVVAPRVATDSKVVASFIARPKAMTICPPRDGKCLDQVAGRGLRQPIAHLIMVGLDLSWFDNMRVVSQSIEELRPIRLRIDRLELAMLNEDLPFRCRRRLGRNVEATASLPNARHTGWRTEILQRVDINSGLL